MFPQAPLTPDHPRSEVVQIQLLQVISIHVEILQRSIGSEISANLEWCPESFSTHFPVAVPTITPMAAPDTMVAAVEADAAPREPKGATAALGTASARTAATGHTDEGNDNAAPQEPVGALAATPQEPGACIMLPRNPKHLLLLPGTQSTCHGYCQCCHSRGRSGPGTTSPPSPSAR